MNHPQHSLEGPPGTQDRPSERRWAGISLAVLLLMAGGSAWTAYRLFGIKPQLPSGPGDHGPLPESVRQEVLSLVEPQLENAQMLEFAEGGIREFRIKGKPRALLSQDFYRAFRPIVAQHLKPLLTPYGEVLSFEITALDLPPMRLRDFAASSPGRGDRPAAAAPSASPLDPHAPAGQSPAGASSPKR